MKIPRCPKCADCKIILAPLPKCFDNLGQLLEDFDNLGQLLEDGGSGSLPVACAECGWRGNLRDVPYVT